MKVYSEEFKADAVALYLSDPAQTYASVAKDLGVNRETLRLWVRQARAGQAGETLARRREAGAAPVASDAVLDWEMWGRAPYGYDAATLYCHTLLQADVAQTVHDTFADMLDTPEGTRTQLFVITRMLFRADRGDYDDLVIPLHRHARSLLAAS
ncbi:transposase [Actinoallomurus purpureus]|uniref:transposase n=1 Tax=Actinoallomurus purpureus TaxID=478114 RepID=UPI0025B03723